MRTAFSLVSLLMATSISMAQDAEAKRVRTRYDSVRPSENELGMYRLDWADSLEVALERAARESRPIFLVIIHAKYGDISSGHC